MKWLYNHRRLLALLLLAIVIASAYPGLSSLSPEELLSYTPKSLILAALALWGIYCVKAVIMVIPVVALYVAAGIVFPTGYAILVTCIGLVIELTIGYYSGRWLGEKKVQETISRRPRISEFLGSRRDNLSLLCFISRIIPIPFDLLSMFLGSVRMPFVKYVLVSLLGLTPVMIPTVLVGESISNPLSPEFLLPFGASLIIVILVFFAYRALTKGASNRRNR